MILNILNKFIYFFYRGLNKLFTIINVAVRYNSRCGVKRINSLEFYFDNDASSDLDYIFIDPSELFLSSDSLKDNYTLLDIPLSKSPHYGFMRALDNGEDLLRLDYVKRLKIGALDDLVAKPFGYKEIQLRRDKYHQMKLKVLSNTYDPVTVYKLNGRIYIRDGKHRAALCCLLSKPVKCNILSTPCEIPLKILWTRTIMLKRAKEYKKALKFIDDYCNDIIERKSRY